LILIDTGPLVALCEPRDRLNRIALRDLDRLPREPLLLCAPILCEACFLLTSAAQRERLRRAVVTLPLNAYRSADEDRLWAGIFDWMTRYQDHAPDWADAYLAVVTGTDPRLKLWTNDREFRTTWRRPDGTAISLVPSR
jgi:predicted nucleic acid-binding protein